jgi:hypothetical protein
MSMEIEAGITLEYFGEAPTKEQQKEIKKVLRETFDKIHTLMGVEEQSGCEFLNITKVR